MIAFRSISKHYGARVALDAVTFTAHDRSITGLLGPNGAGKTTAFRIASGLLKADGGEIVITAPDATTDARAPQPRRLGVLPHAHGLYARLTVREQIRYFGALRGMEHQRLESRVAELVAALGLGDAVDARTHTLSQGQRVKVALACALVHDPVNLILDEPTSGLDVMSTRALHGLLRGLRDRGASVLFSSHVMPEVASLCDHVVLLAHGRVITAGAPADLLHRHGAGSLEDLVERVNDFCSGQQQTRPRFIGRSSGTAE